MTTLLIVFALGVLIGSTLHEEEKEKTAKGYIAPSGTRYLP